MDGPFENQSLTFVLIESAPGDPERLCAAVGDRDPAIVLDQAPYEGQVVIVI
jgi:hypothetical protein